MAQRSVVWGSIVLAGALLASAPWSRTLPPCADVPAAQRERARLGGRCEGRAPIVDVKPGARGVVKAVRRPVPELRGRPFNTHDERLARFVVAIDYRPSAQRRDWVIDQMPRPPSALPEGADLRVVLSDGALVRVPDVRGSFARALALLHRAGLGWSSGDDSGARVVGQVPAAGEAVRPGTRISLRFAPGALALAPESTKPEIAPPPSAPTPAPAPSSSPSAPPAGTAPSAPAPRAPSTTPPTRTAPATTMPDLQGLIFDVARQRLAGYNVERVHRAGTEAGGTVIGQSPAAGTSLAPGATVRLVLSDGSLVRVPRVRSFLVDEARQRLAPGELRPVITHVPNDARAGTVISQQPAEGQIAERGSTVRLTVSSGSAAPTEVAVPNLVGSTLERARAQLGKLQVERSERAAREPVGTILEQVPPAGTRVEPGSTVSVVVSSGGRPEVIELVNVVGQGVDAATAALSEFRLERMAVPSTAPAGRVLGQEPAPGAAVPPGSTVRLRVSDGTRVVAPELARMTLGEARDAARAAGLSVEPGSEDAEGSARVTAQEPPPGTEMARGSALRLVVEERLLPFAVPDTARDAWEQAAGFVRAQSSRNLAIAAVVLLALLALLLLALRRTHRPYRAVEPVWTPAPTHPIEPRSPPARAERIASVPSGEATIHPGDAELATARSIDPPAAVRPEPPAAVRGNPIADALPPGVPPASPAPSPSAAPSILRRSKAAPPPDAGPPPAAVEPAEIRASARLEADPARTVAPKAAPRGPEIRIAARLDAGEAGVRELPPETAPDELTEETK